MIKINLLPEESRRAAARSGSGASPLRVSPVALAAASALVAFGVVGVLGWYWNHSIGRLEQQMQREQAEQARLGAIEKENLLYGKELAEIEQRVRTIQALEDSRTGPVPLMTAIGNTVDRTPDLYLLSLSPEGDRMLLKGQAQTVGSIAGFIAALKQSGTFADVELRRYYQDDQAARVTFKFDLDCVYRPPGAAPVPPPSAVVAGAGAPRTKS